MHVNFPTIGEHVEAVRGVSFEIRKGETLGVVGESAGAGVGEGVGPAHTHWLSWRIVGVPVGQVGRLLATLPPPELANMSVVSLPEVSQQSV